MALVLAGACAGPAGDAGQAGQAGKSAVVRIDQEAAGANCTGGGLAVKTGLDADGNGKLSDAEVDASLTSYVCHGATGDDGAAGQDGDKGDNGQMALVKISDEPKGDNCRHGGTRVESGIDVDGSKTLEQGEVTQTTFVCEEFALDAVYFGDVVIETAEDLARVAGVEAITGDLSIALFGDVSLPDLKRLGGMLRVVDPPGEHSEGRDAPPLPSFSLSLPALTHAGYVNVYADALGSIDLSGLTHVGDEFWLTEAEHLSELSLPSLATVQSHFGFGDLPSLEAVHVPVLQRAGSFELWGNGSLEEVEAPALRGTNPDLDTATIYVEGNDVLTTASFPELQVAGTMSIKWNPALTTLSLPRLEKAERIHFEGNGLADCEPARILARAWENGFRGTVVDNDSDHDDCTFTPEHFASIRVDGAETSYRYNVLPMSFDAANEACAALGEGATLLVLDSADEESAYIAIQKTWHVSDVTWIGYTDSAVEGTFEWVSGSTGYVPSATFWANRAPIDSDGTLDCVALFSTGEAHDFDCSKKFPSVCKVPAP